MGSYIPRPHGSRDTSDKSLYGFCEAQKSETCLKKKEENMVCYTITQGYTQGRD